MILAKTKLTFEDGVLTKFDGSGRVVSAFKVDDIQEVGIISRLEFIGPIFIILPSAAAAYFCKVHVPHEGWSWAGTILFGTLVLLGIVIAKGSYIEVTTNLGKVEYAVMDQIEDVNGFVVALQHEIGSSDDRPAH